MESPDLLAGRGWAEGTTAGRPQAAGLLRGTWGATTSLWPFAKPISGYEKIGSGTSSLSRPLQHSMVSMEAQATEVL